MVKVVILCKSLSQRLKAVDVKLHCETLQQTQESLVLVSKLF